jgi:hypothetical protein
MIGGLVSTYLIWEAKQLGPPLWLVARMLANAFLETALSAELSVITVLVDNARAQRFVAVRWRQATCKLARSMGPSVRIGHRWDFGPPNPQGVMEPGLAAHAARRMFPCRDV